MATVTEKRELYNKEVEITFYPNSHRYKLKGEKGYLIGVTTATGVIDKSRPLILWATRLTGDHMRDFITNNNYDEEALLEQVAIAQDMHQVKKEKAADLGTQVHNFAESFARHKLGKCDMPEITDDMELEVINGINAFLEWIETREVEFIEAERMVYSRKHGYVGTADVVAKIDGELYLCDYKTSKGIYPEMFFQVAAYREAYNEEIEFIGGEKVEKSIILKFNKENGELETREFTQEENDNSFKAFIHALELKKILKICK